MNDLGIGFTSWLASHFKATMFLVLLITAGLAVPFLTMEPEGSASQEPAGEVFEARDLVNERFSSSVFTVPAIIEARGDNLLQKDALLELLENAEALRTDPATGPKLFTYFDSDLGVEVKGLYTPADAIDDMLRKQGVDGIAGASEEEIRNAGEKIIDKVGPSTLQLSGHTHRDANTGEWVVPAATILVLTDDAAVGGPPAGVQLGTDDTTKEEFSREVIQRLRGQEKHFQTWGVAIDVNLTSTEQGEAAGPFIGFTVLAVLLIVGLVYRSYWPVAISGGALAIMIIWLQGLSNLVGMEQDQILSLIVPIAMISFGIDFAFHAYNRYREEKAKNLRPRAAFAAGLAGVMGALVLALSSDAAAFLSNTAAGIQSIVQFGVAAAFGLFAAFILLGIVAPLVLMRIEEHAGKPPSQRWVGPLSVLGSGLAATAAMAAVLLSVFIAPALGIATIAAYILVFILLPVLVIGRWFRVYVGDPFRHKHKLRKQKPGRVASLSGAFVGGVARYRLMLLPVVAIITAVCAFFAVQVPAQFDVKDFFAPSSEFVVSLDKLDEHGGASAGEPATIFVEGDLTNPESVAAMDKFIKEVRSIDSPGFGRDNEGRTLVEAGVVGVLNDVMDSPDTQQVVADTTGVEITDADNDGYPDMSGQIAAIYETVLKTGVPLNDERTAWTSDEVKQVLWLSDDGSRQAARFDVVLTGTREQEAIAQTEADIQPLVDNLESDLQSVSSDARAIFTGAPIARQHSLEAVSRALQVSMPIAIFLCLVIASVMMRSLRYALVSIVPIILVVAWLYAFMYAFGFNLNLVTATIGAISIGIGIDYAIHFTMRYREEMAKVVAREQALRATGESTGMALAASALSSIVGFSILAFAPMPLFASYGLLTAVMIVMALLASLLVLPSLLALVTRDGTP